MKVELKVKNVNANRTRVSIGFLAAASLLLALSSALAQSAAKSDLAHAPAAGTAERKAIVDALREDQKQAFQGQKVVYKVHYLKVHKGWAWIDVTPMNEKGEALAEGGPNLLHLDESGQWKVVDLSKVPEDPKDPLGVEDASPGFIRNLRKIYPDVPTDIFHKAK